MYMNCFPLFAIEMKLWIFLLSSGYPKRVPLPPPRFPISRDVRTSASVVY
jgi:hypothetical protein